MRAALAFALVFVVGCGFHPGPDPGTADAPSLDGPIDADVPDGPDADLPDADDTPDAATCPPPFVSSVHGCHAFTGTSTGFVAGRALCQAMNAAADLPVVQTAIESTFVATLAGIVDPERVRLGLEREIAVPGTWLWV